MSLIFLLIGKSASGKDELARRLLADKDLDLKPVVLYTTRPMREGEKNGREYNFIKEEERQALHSEGRVIEERVYHTVFGDWYYLTVEDDKLNCDSEDDFFAINTIEDYVKYRDHFGADRVVPLYVEVSPDIRKQRAVEREMRQDQPNMAEVERRFIADEKDFSDEKIEAAGIIKRFSNDGDLDDCYEMIKNEIELKLRETH